VTHIIVGIDGNESGEQALRWAYAQARATGATIEAILSWNEHPLLTGVAETLGGGVPLDQVEDQARGLLAAAVGAVAGDDGVEITQTIASGSPGDVLVAAATGADLLVVGRHSSGGGLRLGSVSAHCARHAACPVVVVPAP
jgi:nucleotide-binding universal stress UspA family protein